MAVREHGTNRGYQQHVRSGESACESCRDAHAKHGADERARMVDTGRPKYVRTVWSPAWIVRFPRLYDWMLRPGIEPPCQRDPDAFITEDWGLATMAADFCEMASCPFIQECRLAGLLNNEWGVWGGWSHRKRVGMKRGVRLAEARRLIYDLKIPREWLVPQKLAARGQTFGEDDLFREVVA